MSLYDRFTFVFRSLPKSISQGKDVFVRGGQRT
jgi:hypothetical protein